MSATTPGRELAEFGESFTEQDTRRMRDCAWFAWLNLVRGDRLRLCVALGGATVALFIVLLHVALLRAVEDKATEVYALFDADVVLVSDRFQFLYRMADFPAARLRQALSHEGVIAGGAMRVSSGHWTAPGQGSRSTLMLIGVDTDPQLLRDSALRPLVTRLRSSRHILFDRRSDVEAGPVRVGDVGLIGRQPATVAGLYDLGLPMYAAATAIVSNADFSLFTGADPNRIQMALLQLAPGVDARATAESLSRALPDDVRAVAQADLMRNEAQYFVEVKPLGIMMRSGLVIGLIVGAVALFQALSTQIESRMGDFAVLRAMGHGVGFTYGVGALQLAITALMAFTAAWLAAVPVFQGIAARTHLSLPLDGTLLFNVGALFAAMTAAAGIPLLRAGRADPAGLL